MTVCLPKAAARERFGNIPVYLCEKKPNKDAFKDSLGERFTEILEGIVEVMHAERAGSNRKGDAMLSKEKKLNDLDSLKVR